MEGIITFTGVVMIAFGILQIILFFKLWGMTNDVSRIKDLLESKLHDAPLIKKQPIINCSESKASVIEGARTPELPCINVGDNVIRLSDGEKMIVDSIDDGQYFCKGSFLEGFAYYKREEIESYNE